MDLINWWAHSTCGSKDLILLLICKTPREECSFYVLCIYTYHSMFFVQQLSHLFIFTSRRHFLFFSPSLCFLYSVWLIWICVRVPCNQFLSSCTLLYIMDICHFLSIGLGQLVLKVKPFKHFVLILLYLLLDLFFYVQWFVK